MSKKGTKGRRSAGQEVSAVVEQDAEGDVVLSEEESGMGNMTVNYYFAHRVLPSLVHEGEENFIRRFLETEVLKKMAMSTDGFNAFANYMNAIYHTYCDVEFSEIFEVIEEKFSEDVMLAVVKMPEPKKVLEAKYVLFALCVKGGKYLDGGRRVRYFTYELGKKDQYHACEWSDGCHLNYGHSGNSSLECFVSRVREVLGKDKPK